VSPEPIAPRRDVGVIIVAAGSGTRAGATELKQFRWVAGKPMLLHSVLRFHARPDVAMVVCVLPRDVIGDPPPWLFQSDVERLLLSVGGRNRQESVSHGLQDLPSDINIVAVHDAARPLVTDDAIERVIAHARSGRCAIAAVPVVDTLKEVDSDGQIVRTVAREALWRAQTPQAFPLATLQRVHAEAKLAGVTTTDDAGLCERLGIPVFVVPGSERAMKVTDEADFARATALATWPG